MKKGGEQFRKVSKDLEGCRRTSKDIEGCRRISNDFEGCRRMTMANDDAGCRKFQRMKMPLTKDRNDDDVGC